MAKKTKKEKLKTEQRRQSLQFSYSLSAPVVASTESIEAKNEPKIRTGGTLQNSSIYIYPVNLVRKDLTKTLMLSILAVSLELALFLVLEQHIVLPSVK
jgi:hypothetical protein